METRQEWLNALSEGDKVIIQTYTLDMRVGTVVHRTAQRIRVQDKSGAPYIFRNNGTGNSGNTLFSRDSALYMPTESNLEAIEKKMITDHLQKVSWNLQPLEKLREVYFALTGKRIEL